MYRFTILAVAVTSCLCSNVWLHFQTWPGRLPPSAASGTQDQSRHGLPTLWVWVRRHPTTRRWRSACHRHMELL